MPFRCGMYPHLQKTFTKLREGNDWQWDQSFRFISHTPKHVAHWMYLILCTCSKVKMLMSFRQDNFYPKHHSFLISITQITLTVSILLVQLSFVSMTFFDQNSPYTPIIWSSGVSWESGLICKYLFTAHNNYVQWTNEHIYDNYCHMLLLIVYMYKQLSTYIRMCNLWHKAART